MFMIGSHCCKRTAADPGITSRKNNLLEHEDPCLPVCLFFFFFFFFLASESFSEAATQQTSLGHLTGQTCKGNGTAIIELDPADPFPKAGTWAILLEGMGTYWRVCTYNQC